MRIGVLLARSLLACGQVDSGLHQAELMVELAPDSLAAQVYLLSYRAVVAPKPALAKEAQRIMVGPASWAFAASHLAYVFARCGQPGQARQMVQDMAGATGPRALAIGVLLCLGADDEAMACALAAAAQGCGALPVVLGNAGKRRLGTPSGLCPAARGYPGLGLRSLSMSSKWMASSGVKPV